MKLSRTVGLAVAVSLVAGTVAAIAQISGAAPADPTANPVVAGGTAAKALPGRLPSRLPGVPGARQGHRLDLRERISRPASLGGRMRRRSPLDDVSRRRLSSPASWCGKP